MHAEKWAKGGRLKERKIALRGLGRGGGGGGGGGGKPLSEAELQFNGIGRV